ncbi:hypothetical protein CAC42_5266 [Sphaceloma murrayae]|uniref:H-type lectin domain-containing protein n=1 Tax=Sphaceloma murrayae TaxID=2082308 RepID=A0A2K1QUH8_9PEZI|nr:hypothetical protein CAC42_5266 [Sphaceloma murrayae]
MVHLSKAGPDTGHFNTAEVRSSTKPSPSTSRIIALPSTPSGPYYQSPPNLAAGFNSLHLSSQHPARANLVADSITTSHFRITLETWGSSLLYSGGATWIEHARDARDCLFGQFDTSDLTSSASSTSSKDQDGGVCPRENSKHIRFPRAFKTAPNVVCWLNRLDLPSEGRNYRLRAHASHVSRQGFTAHIDTWGESRMAGAAMCWIAFPGGKARVDSGEVSTLDVRSWSEGAEETRGEVKFGKRFEKKPTVLVALSMVDAKGEGDLKVLVEVEEVWREGFRWKFEGEGLCAAGGSWIALGFV